MDKKMSMAAIMRDFTGPAFPKRTFPVGRSWVPGCGIKNVMSE